MSEEVTFESVIETARTILRKDINTGSTPVVDIVGVRIDSATHRFNYLEDGRYLQVQDAGSGAFTLVNYDQDEIIGEPLVLTTNKDDDRTVVTYRADAPLPIRFRDTSDPSDKTVIFQKACQEIGDQYSPTKHPDMYGFIVKNGKYKAERRILPLMPPGEELAMGRRHDSIIAAFLDRKVTELCIAFRTQLEHFDFDIWTLVMANSDGMIHFLLGPYLERVPGQTGAWITYRVDQIPSVLVSIGQVMVTALKTQRAHDLSLSGISVIGSPNTLAYPDFSNPEAPGANN